MENLGDEFNLNETMGVLEPFNTFMLQMNFRALKAMSIKKSIRIEAADVDNIMGVHSFEVIQVTGEAYDVALDMSFPRGTDGGLDFGVVRVFEEPKQTCSLKNKGKYEIQFKFTLEDAEGRPYKENLDDLFKIMPATGNLIPVDRPTQVQVQFKSHTEINIQDVPVLKCHVIEPNMSDSGETIASIPIKISVRSVFSKYTICPQADINFGPMLVGSKRIKTFTIENTGEFDFKYSISKLVQSALGASKGKNRRLMSRDGSQTSSQMWPDPYKIISGDDQGKSTKPLGSMREENKLQTRIQHGPFTIYPGFGTVQPGQNTQITVDLGVESVQKYEEFLAIEISDRNPDDCPGGIAYKLLAEGCLPTIDTTDLHGIFEEHRVVRSIAGKFLFSCLITFIFYLVCLFLYNRLSSKSYLIGVYKTTTYALFLTVSFR